MVVEQDIKEALLQLLDSKAYNKISVNDIVGRCGIHRNTFYYHFENIPDLIRKISLDWVDDIVRENSTPESRLMPYYAPLIPQALTQKERVLNVYHSVDKSTSTAFIKNIADYAVGRYFEQAHVDPPLSDEDLRAMCHYGRSLFTGIVIDWLDNDMNYDLLSIMNRTHTLLWGGQNEMPLYRIVAEESAADNPA